MSDPNAVIRFHSTMPRGRRTTERDAVCQLLERGFSRVGQPKLWVSEKRGFEEFQFTYINRSNETATLTTRHPLQD